MAVMLLIAVVLIRQKDQDAQKQKDEVTQLRRFTVDLLQALKNAQLLEQQQEGVGLWVETVFKEAECELEFNRITGTLEPKTLSSAGLYELGKTELSDAARRQLESCASAFQRLAICMAPYDESRAELCPNSGSVRAFRDDLEALVLQGNTDRKPHRDADKIGGLRGRHPLLPYPESFVGNAQLGAERARQALGHLLFLIQDENTDPGLDPNKPLQVFTSRARIESPSFGRYQAGANQDDRCTLGDDECSAARNLSLILRWKQESLRKPFTDVQRAFCDEWNKEGSPLRRSVVDKDNPEKTKANIEDATSLCASIGKEPG